ncbi:MAG: M23 family metallopeptidase [Helicobacteraceae bacterium]
MKDKTTITITNFNGSKSYTIDEVFKKGIVYALLGVLAFVVFGLAVIYFLFAEKGDYDLLKNKYHKMMIKNSDLEISIAEKQSKLSDITEKITDIETLIGIKPRENMATEERLDIAKVSAKERVVTLRTIPSGSPLETTVITSKYGWRMNPIRPGREEFHPGIDLRAKMDTVVYATADGIVKKVRNEQQDVNSGYGKLLVLVHGFGFETLYAHLNNVIVKSGQFVKKGQPIAYSGSTGYSNGPHLHYEVRYLQMTLEPKNFIEWSLQNYEKIFTDETNVRWESLLKGIKWQLILLEQQLSQKEQKSTEKSK